jgi:hypothetical protein
MKRRMLPITFATLLLSPVGWGQATKLNMARIDEITGLKGKMNEQEGL